MKIDTIDANLVADYNKYKVNSDQINAQLRGDVALENINFNVGLFDSLIQKYQTHIEVTLYRVMPLEYIEDYNVNDIYSDKAYLSTSRDRDNILQFCKYPQIAVLEVSCKPGSKMINMELSETVSGDEGEFLLARNSRFSVVRKNEYNNYDELLDYFNGDKDCANYIQKLVVFGVDRID